jgi:hypothetical protein
MESIHQFYNLHHAHTYKFNPIPDNVDKVRWITTDLGKVPFLPLQIKGPWEEILKEAQSVDHLYVPHRDDGYSKGWSSICLHGLGATKTDAPSVYPEFKDIPYNNLPFDWTEISELCPVATEYFKNEFPYSRYHRLRFMRLEAGGYITPHRDGTNFFIGAVNISLNNPHGCEMVMGDVGIVPFKDSGSAIALNTSYEHMVWNRSNEARYHIIVHGAPKYPWGDILKSSYESQLS